VSEWEDYERTKSGALTAASKRRIEAERDEWIRRGSAERLRYAALGITLEALVQASERMDSFDPLDNEAFTDREQRIATAARDEAIIDCKRDEQYLAFGMIDGAINHIRYHGIGTDDDAITALEKLRDTFESHAEALS
jgi:hypothetical protein